jgi:sec-independent protein translocase protein TatA
MLLFGGSKLPGLAKGLGHSIKEFKKASREDPEPVPGTAPHAELAAKPVEKPVTADGKA